MIWIRLQAGLHPARLLDFRMGKPSLIVVDRSFDTGKSMERRVSTTPTPVLLLDTLLSFLDTLPCPWNSLQPLETPAGVGSGNRMSHQP